MTRFPMSLDAVNGLANDAFVEAFGDILGVVLVLGEDDRLPEPIAARDALSTRHEMFQDLVDRVGVEQPLVVRGYQHVGHDDTIDGVQRQHGGVDVHGLRQRIIAGVDGVVIGPGFIGAEHVVTAAAPGKGVEGT